MNNYFYPPDEVVNKRATISFGTNFMQFVLSLQTSYNVKVEYTKDFLAPMGHSAMDMFQDLRVISNATIIHVLDAFVRTCFHAGWPHNSTWKDYIEPMAVLMPGTVVFTVGQAPAEFRFGRVPPKSNDYITYHDDTPVISTNSLPKALYRPR
jgi:hypothetical protein